MLRSLIQVVAISVLIGGQLSPSAAARNLKDDDQPIDCDDDLASRVEPFDDKMLPKSQVEGEPLPGLGHLMLLKTYIPPKAIETMGTSFGIHLKGGSVEGIRFRAPRCTGSDCGREYQYDLKQMAESGFDANKRTVVMIPGYRTSETCSWLVEATKGWIELHGDDVNVIIVSWTDSNSGVYSQAVAHTTMVARQLTIFLNYLIQLSGGSVNDQRMLDNIHLIGHSLGAHIAGFVGQDFGGRLGRITGLDPAGPSFDQFPREQRLDRSDARLVEVLHTNSGKLRYLKALATAPMLALSSLLTGATDGFGHGDNTAGSTTSGLLTNEPRVDPESTAWFGIDAQLGHVDYYANDGSEQPGCSSKMHICDHNRAVELYVDMLRYEASLRASPKFDPSRHSSSSLLAFKAANYESFETGENFALECGNLLCTRDHLNQCRQEHMRAKCAIPLLDFIRPLNQLVDDLEHKHGINFAPDAQPELQPRFYFKTSAGSLLSRAKNYFVGEHYLLRIYLTGMEDQFKWVEPSAEVTNWCSLRVQMIMATGEMAIMHMGHVRPNRVEVAPGSGEKEWMVAVPFVHPFGSTAHSELEQMLALGLGEEKLAGDDTTRRASDEFSNIFQDLFPRTMMLSVYEVKPTPRSEEPTCRLSIKALEVQPLDGHCQSIGGLYGHRVALGQRLPVITSEQLVRELRDLLADERAHGTVLASKRSHEAVKSVGSGLEAVLVEK